MSIAKRNTGKGSKGTKNLKATVKATQRPAKSKATTKTSKAANPTSATSARKGNGNAAAKEIRAWQDDPSNPPPVVRAVPKINDAPFATQISETAPSPKVYHTGTPEFRYWAAADSLRRASDFWGSILPKGTKWFTGNRLPVNLDRGLDFNAFYDRHGLSFFHGTVNGVTYFSGESPDVVCHEFGHAILDAIRPELWDVASIETAAFHESFGDMSAILCALQVPAVRASVLEETNGKLYRSSHISRLAEQLGNAIRQLNPQAVEPDCLRNAVNNFFYRDPDTLPPVAPATSLSSEPHSFSRVFTAGFFEALANMLSIECGGKQPTSADLEQVSRDAARLLIEAIINAPIVPDYFSQVAAHMIETNGDTQLASKYRQAIVSAFVRHGILSLEGVASIASMNAPVSRRKGIASMAPVDIEAGGATPVPQVAITAAVYGLKAKSIIVQSPGQSKRLPATPAALAMGALAPPSDETAARSFVEDLFRRGRVEVGEFTEKEFLDQPLVKKTHALVKQNESVALVRRLFDCGFVD